MYFWISVRVRVLVGERVRKGIKKNCEMLTENLYSGRRIFFIRFGVVLMIRVDVMTDIIFLEYSIKSGLQHTHVRFDSNRKYWSTIFSSIVRCFGLNLIKNFIRIRATSYSRSISRKSTARNYILTKKSLRRIADAEFVYIIVSWHYLLAYTKPRELINMHNVTTKISLFLTSARNSAAWKKLQIEGNRRAKIVSPGGPQRCRGLTEIYIMLLSRDE